MYFVYVLQSMKDDNFYTGFSDNLKRRLSKHNTGLVTATKHRLPLKLIYYEFCLNKTDALHREIYLKTSWGKKYIKNRLSNYLM
ncbi:MAG TPA: GIY-YIG nuclease family protein [Patescibacteria group bacterium]|nr:GIY-YIG nuclease family protein [Patescibacteria group bacterium]